MCGIVGILGGGDVASGLIEGLQRLEYRGYDSAGIATVADGRLDRRRAVGKLARLREVVAKDPLPGAVGIGHTRWATHGRPTTANAHPHTGLRVAVVHNGIIENFARLREALTAKGVRFESETDTETIAQAMGQALAEGQNPRDAFEGTLARLEGAFALAVLFEDEPDTLYCARRGSPLAIGRGVGASEGEMYVGSDAYALAPFTNRVTYLADGDWAAVTRRGFEVFGEDGLPAKRTEQISDAAAALVDKGEHRHFMAKEIHEQPEVVGHTISAYLDPVARRVTLPEGGLDFGRIDKLTLSACGTAYYAGLIAKYWFETYAKLPVEADIASELRYRDVPYMPGGAALFVSQSGETADTLAALKDAKAAGQQTCAVVNVPESTMAREADAIYPTHAGPEIGVASTKAFTCQLATLACLAIGAGVARGVLSREEEERLVGALLEVPRHLAEALAMDEALRDLAHEMSGARDVLYLGRGVSFPLAMEGALKLKEISYIHAEGYAAGELKHGPIALIDEAVPVIVLAPKDALFEKTVSNMQEVMARGGKCCLISDEAGLAEAARGGELWGRVPVPSLPEGRLTGLLAPLIYAVPVQLLAYHAAVAKGTDVDQPRNLAKSVTVE
ncbi:glutamine--fructose-6-phosphate transaminase (isomerizing) [Parvularcula dongshanensis]|uniref:Glutamine--fructose-6-phosphate aminotransferase [isomerizing] n=1 Tax=Parvularcula dongshanensis TaxID=1173995 RepID=A0A840I318_9PROT|nr:glutamine--fructose-6-phosphate transaminase (isomerizing) [Parvularcula dongshanensis]MBB4658440.1 glucosamine--fructose-6-phosphate aminotransferase (isomerizing) [Parvularcula dongshanensis]